MSPELTWEILSRLASHTSDSNDQPPPFLCQRDGANSSTSTELFFEASPIHDGPAIYSLSQLQKEFINVLRIYSDGKMSIVDIGKFLGLSDQQVKCVGDSLCNANSRAEPIVNVEVRIGFGHHENGYAVRNYLFERIVQIINFHCCSLDSQYPTLEAMAEVHKTHISSPYASGGISMQYLSSVIEISVSDVTKLLHELFVNKDSWGLDSSAVLVTDQSTGQLVAVANKQILNVQEELLKKQIISALCGVTTPVKLELLFSESSCPGILSLVGNLCETSKIDGTLHHSTYTPTIYATTQKKNVESFFRANGFISEKKCIGLGLTKIRMEQLVKESFPNSALLLKSSIINPNQLCLPLEDAIQLSILNKSFVDLKALLPEEFGSCEDDLITIVKDVLVDQLKSRGDHLHDEYCKGIAFAQREMAFFFCASMLDQARKLLPTLIEDYAMKTAKDVAYKQFNSADNYIIPLIEVVNGVSRIFPDLSDIQREMTFCELSWTPENPTNDGPLIEFCRRAFDLSSLQAMCLSAIRAETLSIHHKVNANSMIEGAAKAKNTGDAFETSFRDMCYLLQIFAKGLQTVDSRIKTASKTEIAKTENELLMSCGSCLARRITEYCLFKHAISETAKNTLIFDCKNAGLPPQEHGFCDAIDFGTLAFPCISLNCKEDENGENRKPLAYLKTLFPPSVGSSLVKMWTYFSLDDSDQHNLNAFINQLSESCLSLVGIPFATLDKKNEKRVLASRKQCITNILHYSWEKEEVLLSAIVFVFLLSKNTSVVGRLTIHLVLDAVLRTDKKVHPHISDALMKLKEDNSEENLITVVKKIWGAKSIKALSSMDINT